MGYNISTKGSESVLEYELLEDISKKNNGILRTSDALTAGISKFVFARFLDEKQYDKVSHGIYLAPDAWRDEMYLLQLRCPIVICSHDSALFCHDLTDREPLQLTVTVKTGYNPFRIKPDGVKVYTVKSDLYEMGIMEQTTTFGNKVRVYDIDRTICDIVRSRNSMETQVFQDALKQYSKRRDKNIPKLMEYAEKFRVDKVMREYMGILL